MLRLISTEDLENRLWHNQKAGNAISLGYINMDINYLDSLAIQNGAIVIDLNDSLLRDGDLSQNPYLSKNILMPFVSVKHINDNNPTFYFDPEIKLTNKQNMELKKIHIEIEGQQLTLKVGQVGTLDLSGIKKEKILMWVGLEFADGGWHTYPYLIGYGAPKVLTTSVTDSLCISGEPEMFESSLYFKGYYEDFATKGMGEFMIFYKLKDLEGTDCEKKLTKSIIVIDGFDPGDERKITRILVNGEYKNGIWDLLSSQSYHVGDSLRLAGFDIVVLNFPKYKGWNPIKLDEVRDGGVDYIERNAFVLTKLIQDINDSLVLNVPDEADRELVIVGPSMGGQISRYALAYMEKQYALTSLPKWKHRTRLWVSFDSPHQGANIPISAQQSLNFFGIVMNHAKAKDAYINQLRNPAARQMLIEQMDGLNGSADFHQQYYGNLKSNGIEGSGGYPVYTRKVSLINGAANGKKTGSPEYDMVKVKGMSKFGIDVTAFEANLYNMPEYGNRIETFTGFMINPDYIDFTPFPFTSFPTTNMVKTISKTMMTMPGSTTTVTIGTVGRGTYKTKNKNTHGSMDVVPGGTYDVYKVVSDKFIEGLEEISKIKSISNKLRCNGRHSFIPSVSALDLYESDFHWATPFSHKDLVCTDEIPFDAYFAQTENQKHVSIVDVSASWLMEEIRYGKQGCPNICSGSIYQLGGDKYLCAGVHYTFNLEEDIPLGSSTVWELSPGLEIVSSNNNSVTLKYNPELLAAGLTPVPGEPIPTPSELEDYLTPAHRYVRAIITPKIGGEQCGSRKTIEKALDYGKIFKHKITSGSPSSYQFKVEVTPHIAGSMYSWKKDDLTDYGSVLSGYSRDYDKVASSEPDKYFYTKVFASGCSLTEPTQILKSKYAVAGPTITMPSTGGGPTSVKIPFLNNEEVLIQPNPTDNQWDIILTQDWVNQKVMVKLYGIDGRELETFSTEGKQIISIDASQLLSGIYIIELNNGREQKALKAIRK